jgi:ferredoxin
MKIAVIGAGPAGWAATSKLVELGHEVTVFCGDLSSEDDNLKEATSFSAKINQKLLRGSDYPYRSFPAGPLTTQASVNLSSSYAFSGLSLVWGATMLPYSDQDLHGWPISTRDLDSGYNFIVDRIPVTGYLDPLKERYSTYFNQSPLLPSKRVSTFFELAEQIQPGRFYIGHSRIAVKTTSSAAKGCNYCGQCLKGCPTEQIWSAPELRDQKVKYKKNLRVLSVSECDERVSLETINAEGERSSFSNFDKLFIGAGNIETFRILAESRVVPAKTFNKDSATFFVPFFLSRKYGSPEKLKNTLSQAFIRYEDKSPHSLQLQIYDYSEDLVDQARKILPFGKYLPASILRIPLSRLFVGIGYLDSARSSEIEMQKDVNGDVQLDIGINRTKSQIDVVRKFFIQTADIFTSLGLRPLIHFIQYALPGEGVHSGGWLPMGSGSDLLGRPKGTQNIHLIDSSTFPSIPAGAITFTVMANAVRIVELATK